MNHSLKITVAVLAAMLALAPVADAATRITAAGRAALLAKKLNSLAYRNLPTTGTDPGMGTAAAVDTAPLDTGVQPGSVVIEGGTVISGPLY